jgi:hypothetical protein
MEPLSIHLTHRPAVLLPPDSNGMAGVPAGTAEARGDTIPIRPAFRPASQSGFHYGYLPTPETPHPAKAQAVAVINPPADSQTDTG